MDAEAMAPANWPAYVAGAFGVAGFAGVWWSNFSRRQRDATLEGKVDGNACRINEVGQQQAIDKVQLTGALDAVEKTQERLIRLLQDENKELRDRYDEATIRHNREIVEFKTEIAALRADVDRTTNELSRRKEDYDKSRVEIHTLRNQFNEKSLSYELQKAELNTVKAERDELKRQNAELVSKQPARPDELTRRPPLE